jgi:hypothetical protein
MQTSTSGTLSIPVVIVVLEANEPHISFSNMLPPEINGISFLSPEKA